MEENIYNGAFERYIKEGVLPTLVADVPENYGFKLCKSDSMARHYYRYLQTIWREKKGLPVKKEPGQDNSEVYGNYTSDPDGNFMTPAICRLANEEMANKGERLIREDRMRENLLSSQPLCFNLFGELKFDKAKALQFFNLLYNDYFASIDEIKFEHNPARNNVGLTGDRSAFDVFVEYTSAAGKKGFIGIEVKYSETLLEGAKSVQATLNKDFGNGPEKRKDRYEELSHGLFKPADFALLEKLPYFQIWRDHLLAVAMCKAYAHCYAEGFFLFLSPRTNPQCRIAVTQYRDLLLEKDKFKSHFHIGWLEDYIDTLHAVFNVDWTRDMANRYLGRDPFPPLRPLHCRTK